MELKITAADRSEKKLFYYCEEEEIKDAKIGHLRMDFGRGSEFYGTWFTTNSAINDQDFRTEFNELLKILQKDLLKNRKEMNRFVRENPPLDLGDNGSGYKIQTDEHTYYLRCKPAFGEYDCYCYCYNSELLEQAMAEEENMEMGGISQ